MDGLLRKMGRIADRGWDFSNFEDFGDWAMSLAGIHKSATLDKHRTTLHRLAVVIEDLARSEGEETEPETAAVAKKGKGKKKAPVVEEAEEEEEVVLYDPPVRF